MVRLFRGGAKGSRPMPRQITGKAVIRLLALRDDKQHSNCGVGQTHAFITRPDDGRAFLLAGTKASRSYFAATFLTPAPFTLTF